jgi:hypothetical protein
MRLHRCRGKETGLMLIGSASELRTLGQSLLSFAQTASELSEQHWPPLAAHVATDPAGDFQLSFHLDTVSGTEPMSNFP